MMHLGGAYIVYANMQRVSRFDSFRLHGFYLDPFYADKDFRCMSFSVRMDNATISLQKFKKRCLCDKLVPISLSDGMRA
jgi:hypothetical protein